MKSTGERYLPEEQDIVNALEHWHRYFLACNYVREKSVVDIASGEGYGSAVLANYASKVLGIDISAEAVTHANNKYLKDNLKFIKGNATELPVELSSSIDVITSFETIEHLSSSDQVFFLQEVVRLLKPNGLFIVSTPNKRVYSDLNEFDNKYHLKEFYLEEFKQFLELFFPNVDIYGQKLVSGSYITPIFSDIHTTKPSITYGSISNTNLDDQLDYRYYIAYCTKNKIDEVSANLYIDAFDELINERTIAIKERNELKNELCNIKNSRYWAIAYFLKCAKERIAPKNRFLDGFIRRVFRLD